MDISKTVAAINDFQNAADRSRIFLDMIAKANVLWEELKGVDAGVLKTLADQQAGLTGEIAALNEQKANLTAQVKALDKEFTTKQNKLASDFKEKEADYEAKHVLTKNRLLAEIDLLTKQLEQLKLAGQNDIATLESRKTSLEQQISNLKAQASAALHA